MKRVVVFVVLVTLSVASPAFAAGNESSAAPAPPAPPAAMKNDFSPRAAGINRLALETEGKKDDARAVVARSPTPAPAQGAGGKSMWGTPWPYLIAAVAIVAIVVVSQNTEGGIY